MSNTKREFGFYESLEGRKLHELICTYCSGSEADAAQNLQYIQNYLTNVVSKNPRLILEKSNPYHHTHIDDVIYLIQRDQHPKDTLAIQRMTLALFDTLTTFCHDAISKGQISSNEYADWLAARTDKGFSIVTDAIMHGNTPIYDRVIKELVPHKEYLLASSTEPGRQSPYTELFAKKTISSLTPLMLAILSGNVGIFRKVATELHDLYTRKKICPPKPDTTTDVEYEGWSREKYAEQFTRMYKDGVTGQKYRLPDMTLHKVGAGMYHAVVEELRQRRKENTLTKRQYAGLFYGEDTADHPKFTILHKTFLMPDIDAHHRLLRYHAVIEELKKDRAQDLITAKEYRAFFTKPASSESVTPLFCAASFNDPELFQAFLKDMRDALSTSELKGQLTYRTPTQHRNVFHPATRPENGNPDIIDKLRRLFLDIFGHEAEGILQQLIHEPSTNGITPENPKTPDFIKAALERPIEGRRGAHIGRGGKS